MADSMGTKETSGLWGYSQNTISRCRLEQTPGATQDVPGSPWHIPENAKCPKPIKKK